MPKISVIVPVYKVEKYLNRCVDSILSQTFTDFECILVDDGSPDSCGKICDEYAEKDKRIRVIHKENGGLSDARNAGLDIAQGEYIGFVDSDDWIHPKMYEALYALIITTNAGIVTCRKKKESEFRDIDEIDVDNLCSDIKVYSKSEIMESYYDKFIGIVGVNVWNKLYKSCIFDDLRFKKGIIYEDDEIMIPTILKADTVAVTEAEMYYYNDISSSIQRSPFTKARFICLDIIKYKNSFFEENSRQYNFGLVKYYEAYIAHSIVVSLCKKQYRKGLKKSFQKYKNDVNGNMLKILKCKGLCKMLRITIFSTMFSKRITLLLAKKFFRHIYDVVIYDLTSLS